MPDLNTTALYKEADRVCSKPDAVPDELQQAAENRLGGSPPLAGVAPELLRAQNGAMQHKPLTLSERIVIQAGLVAGDSQAAISLRLARPPSTLSTELKRNGGIQAYRAEAAQAASVARRSAARRGRCDIAEHPPLRDAIYERMRRGWSPEEIAGTLKRDYPHVPLMHTCHESIYRYVYVVARGELQSELVKFMRRSHKERKPQRRSAVATQGKIPDMVLVDQRPAEVETRLIAGNYEGDLIVGAGNRSAVGVLVERTTRYTMLCHLPEKDAASVREAFTRRLLLIPRALRLSLTYDQGKEMSQHKILAADLGLKVFFCHPHSPWERGTCESQNGRIRHYLPKGMDLSTVSYQQLAAYQEMLNERPRKILGWKSPAQCFQELISKHSSN